MKMLAGYGVICAAAVLACGVAQPALAQGGYDIVEPKKVKSSKQIKPGEGAVQMSVRTQKQFVETAIVYFVALDEAGRDTNKVFRFERGAGVPIMGSNMIDEKHQVYRMPPGRYRPIAFTVACDGMPFEEGLTCSSNGALYPTGFYPTQTQAFVVRAGELTRAGDFIIEFTGQKPEPGVSLFDVEDKPFEWNLRWRAAYGTVPGFAGMSGGQSEMPAAMRSRITCNARPAGVMLYIPFDC